MKTRCAPETITGLPFTPFDLEVLGVQRNLQGELLLPRELGVGLHCEVLQLSEELGEDWLVPHFLKGGGHSAYFDGELDIGLQDLAEVVGLEHGEEAVLLEKV